MYIIIYIYYMYYNIYIYLFIRQTFSHIFCSSMHPYTQLCVCQTSGHQFQLDFEVFFWCDDLGHPGRRHQGAGRAMEPIQRLLKRTPSWGHISC